MSSSQQNVACIRLLRIPKEPSFTSIIGTPYFLKHSSKISMKQYVTNMCQVFSSSKHCIRRLKSTLTPEPATAPQSGDVVFSDPRSKNIQKYTISLALNVIQRWIFRGVPRVSRDFDDGQRHGPSFLDLSQIQICKGCNIRAPLAVESLNAVDFIIYLIYFSILFSAVDPKPSWLHPAVQRYGGPAPHRCQHQTKTRGQGAQRGLLLSEAVHFCMKELDLLGNMSDKPDTKTQRHAML